MYLAIWKCKIEGRYFKGVFLNPADRTVRCPYCGSSEVITIKRKLNVDI